MPYWSAIKKHYGAVILVKGGSQTYWSQFLAHIAEQLAVSGWSVVLLNCISDTNVPWIKQLPEVINVLRQHKNKRITLIHYGDQLSQTLEYFSKPQAKMINGLVMVSAYDDEEHSLNNPPKFRFPLFDVAGQFDYDDVLTQMEQRQIEFKKNNYRAVEMPGAHHDYQYSQELLLSFVHGWMAKLPEFEPHPPPIFVSFIEPFYSPDSHIVAIDESNWSGFIDNPPEL